MTKPTCSIKGCEKTKHARGFCPGHYSRDRLGRDMTMPLRRNERDSTCAFDGCDRRHKANGFCDPHNRQHSKGVTMRPIGWMPPRMVRFCVVDGCDASAPHRDPDHCNRHYYQSMEGRPLTHRRPSGIWYADSNGYMLKAARRGGRSVRVFQHREVMADHIGRPLLHEENVHHLNGDRADNRLSNLELWNTSQPAGQRVEDKADWAIEILRLYRPEALAQNGLHVAPQLAA